MKRLIPGFALCLFLLLSACGGVPLRSMPRLVQLPQVLLEANPAEFMVALQVDARLAPPPGAVPQLVLKLQPRHSGAFEPVDKTLPLQLAVVSSATLGLEAPPAGRRWLVYSLPPATQAQLRQVQATLRQAQAGPKEKSGGSLSVGVNQESLATPDPVLAQTRWDTWLQARQADGFFQVWTGSLAQLQKLGAGAH